MIYITTQEGGHLYRLETKMRYNRFVALVRSQTTNRRSCRVRINKKQWADIHSIFQIKNNKVIRIWDVSLNSFRPKRLRFKL